jgi:hypothetical protein
MKIIHNFILYNSIFLQFSFYPSL